MKVLYYGFVREKFEILQILKKKYNWEPNFFVGNSTEKERFKSDYLSENFAEIHKLRLADFNYSKIKKIPIGQYEFDLVGSKIIPLILTLKEISKYTFPTREKLSFFREMFNFWNSILKTVKIDCIVFYTWPHTATCYSLYLIAKYIFKKKILFIDVIEHFDNFYHTVGYQIEDLSTHYTKYIEEDLHNEDVDKYISNIMTNKKYKRSDHIRWKKNHQKIYALKLIFSLLKSILKLSFLRNSGMDWKNGKKEIRFSNSMSDTKYLIFKLKMSLLTTYYSILYKNKSKKPSNLENNHILFAAQYQPEAASTTFVGYYQDTFAILDMLSSCKSDKTRILYKEHPDTFMQSKHFNTPLYKDKSYWDKIFNYKDLDIISADSNIYEAIDNSLIVVTTSSTTAIESVVRGKPVLLFGNAWYSKCDGIFKISNYEECINAITKIKNGFKPDQHKVKRYLNSVAKSCTKGIIHDKFFHLEKDQIQINNLKIADLIHKKYDEYYN